MRAMKVRKLRSMITGIALTLAVLTTTTAAVWQILPWAAADSYRAATLESGVQNTEFLLVDQNGEVCVYSGETLISRTGIPVGTLPQQNREELKTGIYVRGQAALATLLEDFGA